MKRMMRKVGRSLSRDRFGRKDRSGKITADFNTDYQRYLVKNDRIESNDQNDQIKIFIDRS